MHLPFLQSLVPFKIFDQDVHRLGERDVLHFYLEVNRAKVPSVDGLPRFYDRVVVLSSYFKHVARMLLACLS